MTERGNRMRILWIIVPVVVIAAITALAFWPRGRQPGEVLVLCGGSMRSAMEEIKTRYAGVRGDTILITYGDSAELASQLREARRADLFVCHDPFMPWAQTYDLIDRWAPVARLEAVIAVAKGNPLGIKGLEDLGRQGLRLGMSDTRYSTAGHVVKHILASCDCGQAVLDNMRLQTKGHQMLCKDVAIGNLDAALTWNAVANSMLDKLDIVPISRQITDKLELVTSATYKQSDLSNVQVTIGLTSQAKGDERAVRFYEFAIKQRDVFERLGFSPVKE